MSERGAPGASEGPGIRDAEAILRRAHEDEQAANAARERYRTAGLPRLDPDDAVAGLLGPGEAVVDVRASAVVGRHPAAGGGDEFFGRLCLTTRRLLLIGRAPLAVDLDAVDEVALAGERLLVSLRDGTGLTIEASRPRLLRVQIAAALAGART